MVLTEPTCIWWRGPDWLRQPEDTWPPNFKPMETTAECKIERTHAAVLLANATLAPKPMFDIEEFGTLHRLLRYTAYVLREYGNAVADRLNRPELRRDGVLTATEFTLARNYWIRQVQSLAFPDDLNQLQRNGKVLHTSSLSTLNPYLDPADGIIKLRARTGASRDIDHPPNLPILPNKISTGNIHRFVILLVRSVHFQMMHARVRDTLVELRQSCWIIKGRQVVKQVLKPCVPCNRIHKRPFQQPTAPLPMDRCSFSQPFDVTGLDFAGPFYLKGAKEKAWMCIFTCASTRAIHLELVQTMSTPCFIMALDRFIARRGSPRLIYSDNAKTFKAAARNIANRWKKLDAELAQKFGQQGIEWKFIVEGAPWWGGWWERMVGSVKVLLKKMLGRASLWPDELETQMIRAEAVVNWRPITFVYDDHREPQPLCPAHFLLGHRSLSTLPPDDPTKVITQVELADRLRQRELLMAGFERRWKTEYLQERALHFKHRLNKRQIQLGEVVLIMDEDVKRQLWRMGVVVELYPGRDGVVRAVSVRTTRGVFKRAVQKLCSLEIVEEPEENADIAEATTEEPNLDVEIEEGAAELSETNLVEPAPPSRGENVRDSVYRTRFGRNVRPVPRLGL